MYPNQLWKNLGTGTFVDVAVPPGVAYDDIRASKECGKLTGGHTCGVAWGDFNNDGTMDAYICNLSHPRVMPMGDPSMFVVNQRPAADYAFANRTREACFIAVLQNVMYQIILRYGESTMGRVPASRGQRHSGATQAMQAHILEERQRSRCHRQAGNCRAYACKIGLPAEGTWKSLLIAEREIPHRKMVWNVCSSWLAEPDAT